MFIKDGVYVCICSDLNEKAIEIPNLYICYKPNKMH